MKIALMNEFSQASKNSIIFKELKNICEPLGYDVYNTGMENPLISEDMPMAYTEENPRLTYLNLGIQAAILLNSEAVDFVVTGCGTGQGALMALNMFPGVMCGYCVEPTDAYLFLQINNGNALSIPYAKGFGWGAELNLNAIFQKAFSSPKGMGYPKERKESQNQNANLLGKMKQEVSLPFIEGLKKIDSKLLKASLTPRFLKCFEKEAKIGSIKEFILNEIK